MQHRRHGLLGSDYSAAYKLVKAAIEGTGVVLTDLQNAAGDRLVRDLQGESNSSYATTNVWDKLLALYGMLGGTGPAHKFNWLNPVSTDAAYRLLYGGTSHASTGLIGHCYTNLVPATALTLPGGTSLGVYNRTAYSPNTSQEGIDGGVQNTGSRGLLLSVHNKYTGGGGDDGTATTTPRGPFVRNLSGSVTGPVGNGLGFYQTSRVQASDGTATTVLWKNGTQIGSAPEAAGAASLPTGDVWFGVLNLNGSAYGFSQRENALCYVGNGLSAAQLASLDNAVQAYQYRLGRQV